MVKNPTHVVKLPDGTVAGRKTDRVCTHAIVFQTPRGWEVHYCGSRALADKSLASAKGWIAQGAVILPVETVGAPKALAA